MSTTALPTEAAPATSMPIDAATAAELEAFERSFRAPAPRPLRSYSDYASMVDEPRPRWAGTELFVAALFAVLVVGTGGLVVRALLA